MIFQFLLCLCFIEFYGVHAKTETEIKELLFREGVACNKDFPVTPEEIIMLKDNKLPDSTNAKCLIACIFKKTGMIDSKGMFDPDNSITMIEKDFADNAEKLATAKKLMDACRGVNEQEVADGEKGCDRAKHLFKCIVDSSAKLGIKLPH